jgi:hypothetical protein
MAVDDFKHIETEDQVPYVEHKSRMAREDKIVLSVIIAVLSLLFIGGLLLIQAGLALFGYATEGMSDGIGMRSAFLISLAISFIFMIVFASIAGDGVVGELGLMLVGYFIMVIFFTVSIAVIL